MSIELKDLKQLSFTLWDTGSYYYIEATPIKAYRSRSYILYPSDDRKYLKYGRVNWKPGFNIHDSLSVKETLEILNSGNFFMGRLSKDGIPLTRELIEETEKVELPSSLVCLAGNIIDAHSYGKEHQIVHGTKHFSPGTKVYCYNVSRSDPFDRFYACGKLRGSRSFATVILDSRYIENFRATVVYSPSLIRKLLHDGVWFESMEEAENFAKILNKGT